MEGGADMKKKNSQKILKAFSGKEFSKKCQKGMVDDSEFYQEQEERGKREARNMSKALKIGHVFG